MGDGQDYSNGAKAFDTGFLQNAINAAGKLVVATAPPVGGLAIMSTPAVDFGSGIYTVTSTLQVDNGRMNLFSDSGAGLIQPVTPTPTPILNFSNAYQIEIRGLRFVNGSNAISFNQEQYLDATMLRVTGCEFEVSTGFAILTTPFADHVDIDGFLTVDDCKFFGCVGAVYTVCDVSELVSSWIETPVTAASTAWQPMIVNAAGGMLWVRSVTGVTGAIAQNAPQLHWIKNHGSIYVFQSYFQGENAGIPFLFHYGDLPAEGSGLYNEGFAIVLRDSAIFCGTMSPQNPNCAFITIFEGCPQRVIVDGMIGPGGSGFQPIIQAAGQYNLSSYVAQHPNAARYIKVSIDANLVSVNAGTIAPIDPALMPYLNPYETSPFPMGAQYGTPLQAPNPVSQARYQFELPASLNGAGGFTAILTISANPNIAGSYVYRASASYLIGMTTAMVGGVLSDILSWAPLGPVGGLPLPPGTYPGVNPSITSLQFDVGGTNGAVPGLTNASTGGGYALRPTTGGHGGSFTVTWDSNAGVPISFATISIQPTHMLG
jgi:hypothetical protein